MEQVADDHLDLGAWRDQTLRRVFPMIALLATPAALGGAWLSARDGIVPLAAFDVFVWLLLVLLAGGRGSYLLRASVLTGLFFAVGVVVIAWVGPAGVGHLWLTPTPMLGGLLFGRRGLVAWLVAAEAAVALLYVLGSMGLAPNDAGGLLATPAWWVMVAGSIASISVAVGLPMVLLVEGLGRSQTLLRRARDEARIQEAIQTTARRRFEHLFAETPAALLLVDAENQITRVNHTARELFGGLAPENISLVDVLDEVAVAAAERACASSPNTEGLPATYAGAATGYTRQRTPLALEIRVVPIEIDGAHLALIGALDVSSRVAAEHALELALQEKVTLLQEVHHRVKNNLQIVSSLLEMQADQTVTEDARAALLESTHRVRSMALIHQQLYSGETFSRIDLGEYARRLTTDLCSALAPDAELRLTVASVFVPLERALPCGLILHELVTNALKHGRSADGVCRLVVSLAEDDRRAVLSVSDDGPGLRGSWDSLQLRSLGGRVVTSLVRQLRATLQVGAAPGACFTLSWENDEQPVAPDGSTERAPGARAG